MIRRLLKVFVFLFIALAVIVTRPWQYLPTHWDPSAPLVLTDPMNPVTRWKLSALDASPQACLDVLDSAPANFIDYLPLEDYTPVAGCPLSNVVRVTATGVAFSSRFTAACPLLVRWVMFEYQALQPLAQAHLNSPVDTVEHLGTFACRNVYGRERGRRSQHATASAFDVAGFTLENGEQVNVLGDWNNAEAPAKADFLQAAHQAACGYFGTVLGPDYNQAHANHFHLDSSRFSICR